MIRLVAAAVCSAAVGLGLASAAAHAPDDARRLFPRPYDSTAVLEDGRPHDLFDGAEIRVDFIRYPDEKAVRWSAGCNTYGGRLEIVGDRLEVGQVLGTQVGCSGPVSRQGGWVNRFFDANPRWRSSGRAKLKLISGDRVIKLRRGGEWRFSSKLEPPARANGSGHLCPERFNPKTDPFDADRLVGRRLPRAWQIAGRHGCTVRVVKRDGQFLFVTHDYVSNRINVAVRDGRIKRVFSIG